MAVTERVRLADVKSDIPIGTTSRGEASHALYLDADSHKARCSAKGEIIILGDAGSLPGDSMLCSACSSHVPLQAAKGETGIMAQSPTRDELAEQISANVERIRSLAEADNSEGVEELSQETEKLISSIKGQGSVAVKREMRTALSEAAQGVPKKQEPAAGTELVTTEDYALVEGVKELVTEGAEKFTDGVSLQLKTADTAKEVCWTMLNVRLRLQYKGSPDLKAQSYAARAASAQLKKEAVELIFAQDPTRERYDAEQAAEKLWKSYSNQIGDILAIYARGLDETPDEFAERFPLVQKAHPDLKPSEAVSTFYDIALEGPTEKARRKAAEKRELQRKLQKALEAGKEEEAQRLQAEAEGLDGQPEPSPSEKAKTAAARFRRDTKTLSAVLDDLDEQEKAAVRDAALAAVEELKSIIAATL